MISLEVKSELPKGIKWTNEMTKQLPYSCATALNTTVQGSKFVSGSKERSALSALAGASKQYLDRPKPQTQKGFFATKATKRNLQTIIKPKTKTAKGGGWSRNRYLSGSILGGQRAPKDWEAAFVNHPKAINMPKGVQLVPTKAARKKPGVDKYGNFTLRKIQKLYDSVGTSGRTGSNIFIGTPRTPPTRPPGVYRRERRHQLRALFIAVDSVTYGRRFPAKQVVEKTVQRRFGKELRTELNKNVSREVKKGTADLRTGLF